MDNQTEQLKTSGENASSPVRRRRVSNFEVLRIVAIAIIIIHHYFDHSQVNVASLSYFGKAWYYLCWSFGRCGVILFIMISGYFSCTSRFNLKRLIMLWLEVLFYSVLIYIIFFATGQIEFSSDELIKNLFPIMWTRYWFATCYVALMIVSPLLNLIIKHLSRSRHFVTCVVGAVIYSVVPTFFAQDFLYLNEFITFIFLYILAAYLRKYGGLKIKIRTDILIIVITAAVTLLLRFLAIEGVFGEEYDSMRFSELCSIFMLIISVACLEITAKSKPFTNKAINWISKSTFGVYLIHDNPYVRSPLWDKLFKVAEVSGGNFVLFVLHTIGAVIAVYAVCSLVDALRRFIEKPVSSAYDKLSEKLLASRPAVKARTFLHNLDEEK